MTAHPDWWDPYSCQPYKLAREDKPRMSPAQLGEYLKILGTLFVTSPALAWSYARPTRHSPPSMGEFAGLSIASDGPWLEQQVDLVEELGVNNLLLRFPTWEMHRLDSVARYLERFPRHRILINVLQCRDSLADPERWRDDLRRIFETLGAQTEKFQVGNAVNRTKWGCRHSGEALALFSLAHQAREGLPGIELLTSSVIDFEPLVTLRTLVNLHRYRSDGCAAQLYINRRGSSYGKQYGVFDLERKLRLIRAMVSISNNTRDELWITEVNWPLLDTRPYTPNSGHPRSTVDEATQAQYLTQYFDIARCSGMVRRVYWWQLINPGFGLVDHRSGSLRKMPSYHAFRTLLATGDENSGVT